MSSGLYRAAIAMVGHERRLDAIASNLANLGTTGFKRESTATHEFVIADASSPVSRGIQLTTQTDFTQGNLKRTERRYDFALVGSGFFAVEGPNGEVLTRNGEFRLSPRGVLQTDEGYAVAWKSRGALIDPNGEPILVDGEGNVRQGLSQVGKLRLVDYDDKSKLKLTTGGFWEAPADLPEATVTAAVNQYALEESNATGVEEIIAMIGVQRAFGSVANLTQSIKQSYSRLTRSF